MSLKFVAAGAVGLCSFLIAGVAAVLLLSGFYVSFDALGPSDVAAREMLAVFTTVATVAVAVAILVGVPVAAYAKMRVSVVPSVIVSGCLGGIAAHWLFIYVVINSCSVNVSFPYAWVNSCQT